MLYLFLISGGVDLKSERKKGALLCKKDRVCCLCAQKPGKRKGERNCVILKYGLLWLIEYSKKRKQARFCLFQSVFFVCPAALQRCLQSF